jgi:hypothetical protein
MAKPKPDPFENLPPVDAERLASELGLKTTRRLNQLAQEGLPKIKANSYPLLDCFRWYVRRIQRAMPRRENIESESPGNSFRDRLMKVQAERAEMDLLKTRSELIPVAAYEQHMTALVIAARERLLQLPGRLAALIVSLENPADRPAVKKLIDEEIRAMLTMLGNPNEYNSGSLIPGNGGGPRRRTNSDNSALARAAAPTDFGMGERKPDNSPRRE